MLRVFLWKETRELMRDKKTILATVLLPFVMFPLIGLLLLSSSLSPTVVSIVVDDPNAYRYAYMIAHVVNSSGGVAVIGNSTNAQITIIIPRGFSENVTNLSRPVVLIINSIVSPTPSAQNVLDNVLYNMTVTISFMRIHELAERANVTVNPSLVWNPVNLVRKYVTIQHAETSTASATVAQLTRLLVFIVFPSSSPVVFYLTESIIGERDRRTLEALLSTPISVEELIYSKLLVSFVLGLFSGLGDILGVLFLILATGFASGIPPNQIAAFMAYVVGTVVGILLVSAFVTLAFLYILGSSSKVFQVINVIVVMLSLAAAFYGLFFTPSFLSFPSVLALLVPYIQFAAALLVFAFGNAGLSLVIYFASLTALLVGIKLIGRAYSSERLLLK